MRVVAERSVVNTHPASWRDVNLALDSEILHPTCCLVLHVPLLSLLSYLFTSVDLFKLIWPDFSKVFDIQRWPEIGGICRELLAWEKNQASQIKTQVWKNNYTLILSLFLFQPPELAWFSPTLIILPVISHLQWNRKPGYPDGQFCGGECWGDVPHAGTAPRSHRGRYKQHWTCAGESCLGGAHVSPVHMLGSVPWYFSQRTQ